MNAMPPAGAASLTWSALDSLARWVAWQVQERDNGKPTKVPHDPKVPFDRRAPGQGQAKANDPGTWGTLAKAEAKAKRLPKPHGLGGIGIELGDLGNGRALIGIDLDTCVESDGSLAPWATDVVERMGTFGEWSPSGTGAKLYGVASSADLDALRTQTGIDHGRQWKRGGGEHPSAIELHISNRYFAVTREHLPGTPIELCAIALDTLLWLIRVAGPAFAGKGQTQSKANGQHDQSRSSIAFRKGIALRRDGATFTGMCDGLAADPETAEWVREKGRASDARELWRIWDAGGDDAAPARPEMIDHPDMSVLRLHRRAPPALSVAVFGPRWSDWITTAAAASACPPDYVAAPLLSIASALIGNARWPEAWPGWEEPPHLWICGVGDSGSGKSPGADVLLRDVLPTLEHRMCVDHPETMRAWVAAAETDKAAREVWESEVRTAHKSHLAAPLPPAAAAQEKPETPRLRQNDVTIEKVASLLASASPKGLIVIRDEMLGWVAGMNAYNDAGRAFWIESYGGRRYRVERQKHPEPIDVPRLVVAVFGGTQPAKVAGLLKDADDGLLGRICWFWPDPVPFRKGRVAPGVAWAIDALDHLRRLDLLPGNGSDVPACPMLVPLDDALHDDMEAFGQEMQARQAEAGGLMQSAFGKARGLVLRLSLVLTYLRWAGDGGKGSPPVRIERAGFTAAAHLVADYLMPMAERVYGDAATKQDDRDAATLARWIVKTRPIEVHVRKMQREVRLSGLGDADAIHAAAAVLVDAGWLVPPKVGFGVARKVAYVVNPLVLDRQP